MRAIFIHSSMRFPPPYKVPDICPCLRILCSVELSAQLDPSVYFSPPFCPVLDRMFWSLRSWIVQTPCHNPHRRRQCLPLDDFGRQWRGLYPCFLMTQYLADFEHISLECAGPATDRITRLAIAHACNLALENFNSMVRAVSYCDVHWYYYISLPSCWYALASLLLTSRPLCRRFVVDRLFFWTR